MNKLSAFSLLGVFLAAVAVVSGYERTIDIRTLLIESSKVCMKKVTDENDDNNPHDAINCYNACLWKTAGLFVNNTFDLVNMVPTAQEMIHPHLRKAIRIVVYTCVARVYEIPDECQKATQYMGCVRNMAQQNEQLLAYLQPVSKFRPTTPASAPVED